MECLEDEILALAEGRLLPGDVARVDAHLDACAICRAVAAELARGGTALDAAIAEPLAAGRYELGPEVARGGMGRIRRGYDRQLGREVALKELLVDSATGRARLAREARLTARLQHPGIVPVYQEERSPTGTPFYVMRLVDGVSLEAALAEATTLNRRLALLPAVITAAEAVAYAHSRRIVHRDVKPANILLGDFGETVVVDWGLGKDLVGGADLASMSAPPDSPETIDGTVLGTPTYMPPEQASGHEVDQRADVYALGAVLYHLCSGAPPYVAQSTAEILAAVRTAPPVPLVRRARGVPRDLDAIVARAMQRDPTERYPDAGALASDLRRFQTGQLVAAREYGAAQLALRWIARRRRMVAVVGLALLALIVVAVVGTRRVLDERTRADRERAAAEDLVEFMIGDLRERLEAVGRLDALDAVGARVEGYYQDLAANRGTERSIASFAAAALLVSDAAGERGALDQRDAAVQRAQDALAARCGAALLCRNPRLAMVATETLLARGDAALLRGEFDRSNQAVLGGLAASETIVDPADRALVRAKLFLRQSFLTQLGQAGDTVALRDAALAELEPWVRTSPIPRAHGLLYVSAQRRRAQFALDHDDQARARAALLAAEQVATTLRGAAPNDVEVSVESAVVKGYLATIELAEQRAAAAEPLCRSALELLELALARDPARLATQVYLAREFVRLSEILSAQGQLGDAMIAGRRAVATADAVLVQTGGDPQYLNEVAVALRSLADLTGRGGETIETFQLRTRSVDVHRQLIAQLPDDAQLKEHLPDQLRELAQAEFDLGRGDAARGHADEALALYAAQVAIAPGRNARVFAAAQGYLQRARIHLTGTPRALDVARSDLSQARALLAPLRATHVPVPDELSRLEAEVARATSGR